MHVVNRLIADGGYGVIVASQDWHPANHGSFASQHPGKRPFETGELSGQPQMLWPDHCIQDTPDADLHTGLDVSSFDYIQQKGENPAIDSYSAFRDNDHAAITGLASYLKAQQISELDICGLATDYCVQLSVLDAVDMLPGVTVRFIQDASRAMSPEGEKAAIVRMLSNNIAIIGSADILRR